MAVLTVTLKEELELNGRDRGSEITEDITGITETFHRVLDVGTFVNQTLLQMTPTQNDTGGGILFTTNLKYLRITNLDSTNEVALTIQNDSTEEYMVKLEGGHSYVLFNSKINANAAGDSSVSYGGLTDIDKILAKAQGATCQVEVFSALS